MVCIHKSDFDDKGISKSNRKSKKTVYLMIGLIVLTAVVIAVIIVIIIIIIKKRNKQSDGQEATTENNSQEVGFSTPNSCSSHCFIDNPLFNDNPNKSDISNFAIAV